MKLPGWRRSYVVERMKTHENVMKRKRPMRRGCVVTLLYWFVTAMLMLVALPEGFFQVFCGIKIFDGDWNKRIGTVLDVVTAPVQVPLCGIICGYDWIESNTGGHVESRVFQDAMRNVDRVVVRGGGYGCCCDIDKAKIYCVLTNKTEIATFSRMFRFCGKGEGCNCCGDLGVDWWQRTNRIALTAIHHGEALQWKGFDGGFARLRGMSSREILSWYKKQCVDVPDRDIH